MSPGGQVASLLFGYAAAGVFWGALAAAAPAVRAAAGLDPAGFGLALGAMALAAFPVMSVTGRVIHRHRAKAIPAALGVFALGALLLSRAEGALAVVLALAILGGASGGLDIALNLRTDRIETETGRRLFNLTHAVFPLAMLGASAATGWARAEGAGLGAVFLVVALFLAAAALAEAVAGAAQTDGPRAAGESGERAPLSRLVILLGAVAAMAAFQEVAPQNWAAIFVEEARGGGAFVAGLAPAAFTLGMSAGRIAAHGPETRLMPRHLFPLAAVLSVTGFAALALPLAPPALLLACLAAGAGVGPVEPAVFRAAARRAGGAMQGLVLARVTGLAYLGYLLSPPALGAVADGFGWTALWLTAAGLAALTALVARALPPA